MLLLASGYSVGSTSTTIEVTAFCVILLIQGIRHYRGYGRWLMRFLPFDAGFFAVAWYGALGLLLVLDSLLSHISGPLALLFAIPIVPVFAIAMISLVWLPARLLPGWYRDWRAHGRPLAEIKA